jgi:hypothetical protein
MNTGIFNFNGIIIGAVSFIIIGIFHPLVIKGEYYIGKNIWLLFLAIGIISTVFSLLVENLLFSVCLGVFGFSSFWGIKEVFEQIERVREDRFPKNPRRNYD